MSNPHYALADERIAPLRKTTNPEMRATVAQVEATLAVAYEARTANILAFFAQQPVSKYHTLSNEARRDYIKLHATLETRLGLGDTK